MLCISALNFNSSEEIKRLKSSGAANLMAETIMYRTSAASIPAENAALTLKRIGLFLWGRRYEP